MSYVLYLDRYHLGDVLFLQSLARAFGGARGGAPASVIVHGSGEEAERLLEGEGYFVEREGGVLPVTSAAEAAFVERAVRQLNRKLVALFTDAVVATVGVIGTDRGLLQVRPDGAVALHRPDWLRDLTRQRVVPVIGALARAPEGGRTGEVDGAEAARVVAQALDATVVLFTRTNLPGLMDGRTVRETVRLADVPDGATGDGPGVLRTFVAAGLPVLLTNTTRFAEQGGPVGTRIVP